MFEVLELFFLNLKERGLAKEVSHHGRVPHGSCYNSFSLGSLVQLISLLTSHCSEALQESGRLVLWPEQII